MRRVFTLLALSAAALTLLFSFASAAFAAGPQWVIVNPGDTLFGIAARYGTNVDALMSVNNLPNPNFVYSGQRLLIPYGQPGNPVPVLPAQPNAPAQPQSNIYYTVTPGDTLASIAARYGVSAAAIAAANHLTNWNFVWYGQRLQIPGATSVGGINPVPQPIPVVAPPQQVLPAPANAPTSGKWIDVNVRKQTITAYEGNVAIKTILVSTGVAVHPTVLGTFQIKTKYAAVRMTGGTPGVDYYDLPNVPYTMFFYQGYAIHGTYWHHNFGHPMSHGCVNLPTNEAKWFYEWAPVGTTVVTHL